MPTLIDTDIWSSRLRERAVDLTSKKLLITNFHGSSQEKDLSEPANCMGFGRIRHFRRIESEDWPFNPLPIDPASKALCLGPTDSIRSQVFQNAICNWRCWYCFVPFNLLSAHPAHSQWLSASELVDLYLKEPERPPVIDLSGGQPDLIPEWVPWIMWELRNRGLADTVYLWSDDNLSNDYFWRFTSEEDRELIASYRNYGRVCCFKGFSEHSFSFNTRARPEIFHRQFELMSRLLSLGIDIYAYSTFTTPVKEGIRDDMRRFIDSLQEIHVNLPLRTVPLKIRTFTPVDSRMNAEMRQALEYQQLAVDEWRRELELRFSAADRARLIADIRLD